MPIRPKPRRSRSPWHRYRPPRHASARWTERPPRRGAGVHETVVGRLPRQRAKWWLHPPAAPWFAPAETEHRCPAGGLASLPGSHPVSDAAHRDHVARGRGVVAELAAKVSDMDVDEMLVADPVLGPHGF